VRRTGEGNSVAAKVAIVILADTETRADRAKVANALTTAYEFKEAGTRWIAELSDSDHRLHRAFELVKDKVAGACKACAVSFGVKDEVEASGVPLLAEYRGHQSLRKLVAEGFQVIIY
jgi:hypothetical protein